MLSSVTTIEIEHVKQEVERHNKILASIVQKNHVEDFSTLVFKLVNDFRDENPLIAMTLLDLYCSSQEHNECGDFESECKSICQILALLDHIENNIQPPEDLIQSIQEGFKIALKTSELMCKIFSIVYV